MIQNIVFDIGNVLMKYDPDGCIYGTFERQTADRVCDALFHSGLWVELDRGIMPEKEILAGFMRRCPDVSEQIAFQYENMGNFCSAYSGTLPWLRRLKKDYRLYYLSNYSVPMRRRTTAVLNSFLPLMDGGIFSCDVGKIKPDPEIYQMLFDRYCLDPSQCVFLDDSAVNVRAAEALGMRAVVAGEPAETRKELDRLLEEA